MKSLRQRIELIIAITRFTIVFMYHKKPGRQRRIWHPPQALDPHLSFDNVAINLLPISLLTNGLGLAPIGV